MPYIILIETYDTNNFALKTIKVLKTVYFLEV